MEQNANSNRIVKVSLFLAGFALAATGQVFLSFAQDGFAWGITFYAGALLIFLSLHRVIETDRQLTSWESHLLGVLGRLSPTWLVQVAFAVPAALAIVLTVSIASSPRPSDAHWPAFYAWLFAVAALSIAFVFIPLRASAGNLKQKLENVRTEIIVVALITLVGLILRGYDVNMIPYPLTGDEASIGLMGRDILAGYSTNMFVTGWQSQPSMSFLLWAISMRIWGDTVFGLRILAALLGSLAIPALYILVRSMFNRQIALLSAALLAVMSVHIHFSRLAVSNIENPLLACLAFWLAYQAIETRRTYWFGAAGIVSGLAMYSFVGSRLVLLLAVFYVLLAYAMDRTLWKEWPNLFAFCVSLGLLVLPLSIYFGQHLDIGFARMNQVGAFQSGWVQREILQTGQPLLIVILEQIERAFRLFVSGSAVGGFYDSPYPIYDGFWSLFFLVGLIFSLLRIRERRHWLIQLWLWSVLFFGGALLEPPPQVERFAMVFPAVALFAAFGIWQMGELISRISSWPPLYTTMASGAAVAVLTFASLGFYFLDYTPHHYFTNVNSEVGMELGAYLEVAPRNARVYFLGEPRMFYDFPSIPFLSRKLPGVDVHLDQDLATLLDNSRPAIVVALPERAAELEQVRRRFPSGTFTQANRRFKPDEVLYFVYTISF